MEVIPGRRERVALVGVLGVGGKVGRWEVALVG